MAASMSGARREFIEIYIRGRLRDIQSVQKYVVCEKDTYFSILNYNIYFIYFIMTGFI